MERLILIHLAAICLGVLLDLLIGDPEWLPHPVRLMGKFIGFLEKKLLSNTEKKERNRSSEFWRGLLLWVIVTGCTAAASVAFLALAFWVHWLLWFFAEAVLTFYVLAAKNLAEESTNVYQKLKNGTIEEARNAVGRIVGRDTKNLDPSGITRAAVETVAENTSDGVIAPLFFTCLFGPAIGLCYKAVNTMDSMLGYHNDRYEFFGKAAARLDDVFNFIPARLSALFMLLGTALGGQAFSFQNALRIFRRDRYAHKSPNSAQTESVMAGALRVRLAGDASYFGVPVKKPYIGDDLRPVEAEDIKRANRLMFLTEGIALAVFLMIGTIVFLLLRRG